MIPLNSNFIYLPPFQVWTFQPSLFIRLLYNNSPEQRQQEDITVKKTTPSSRKKHPPPTQSYGGKGELLKYMVKKKAIDNNDKGDNQDTH